MLMSASEEERKSLLMKVKEESEKSGKNATFKKLRSWPPVPLLHGETMETGKDFIFLGSKSLQIMTAAMKLKDACSLEEKL